MNFDMKNLYLGLADHRIRANLMAIANPRYICTYVVSSRCVIINRMSNTLTPQYMLTSPPPPPLPHEDAYANTGDGGSAAAAPADSWPPAASFSSASFLFCLSTQPLVLPSFLPAILQA